MMRAYTDVPTFNYHENMREYVLEPAAFRPVPVGERSDLLDPGQALIDSGERVPGYAHAGYWSDTSSPDDYNAQEELAKTGSLLLPGEHREGS